MSIENITQRSPTFDRPAFTIYREESTHPVVLICEHASNYIPPAYHNLGLAAGTEHTHIGWDPGALPLATRISEILDATLIVANYSRLLIDLNRPLHATDSIPGHSDTFTIPSNLHCEDGERKKRQELIFKPFHDAVSSVLDHRKWHGYTTRLVSIHTFTRFMNGIERPWELGVLYKDACGYAQDIIFPLNEQGVHVGDNQPYQVHPNEDVAVPVHGDCRGLPSVLLEIRNDLLADNESLELWAKRLAPLL